MYKRQLLENYEQESYYRRNRWRSGNTDDRRNEQPRDTRQTVNYVRANHNYNNNYNNSRYQGRQQNFNNRSYHSNSYQREEVPQRSRSEEHQRSRNSEEERRHSPEHQPRENVKQSHNNDGSRGNGYQQ